MASKASNHEFFELMKAEHQHLMKALGETSAAIRGPDRCRSRIQDLMNEMTDVVAAHFRHEEEAGYLSEALQRAPHLRPRADRLLEQHIDLQESAEMLRLLIHSGVESPAWWNRVVDDFATFRDRLLEHEDAENRLVQDAFNQDIGVGD